MNLQKPQPLGLAPSFGFGDRLGLATPGHLSALQEYGGSIRGIFAQQSIREMERTQRTPAQVMQAAVSALSESAAPVPHGVWGADADHLKNPEDVVAAADAGFVFFTIDPSDYVDQKADNYDHGTIEQLYTPTAWVESYLGKTIRVPQGPTITLDELSLKRTAVKYGRAIIRALELATHIRDVAADRQTLYEIEVSVDETEQPTTLIEHYLIADLLIRGTDGIPGIEDKLVSLAPRFIGELEKGIDYIGDIDRLEISLRDHASVAQMLGPYKLSLHSGSDKLSIYAPLARATQGLFHIKTAGTSYLEALRVVAHHDSDLFRRVIDFSRSRYDTDRATYHVHADNKDLPVSADVGCDQELVSLYLEHWEDVLPGKGFTEPGRQILHCTFGSVMADAMLGSAIHQLLVEHADTHNHVLIEHFGKHLKVLNLS